MLGDLKTLSWKQSIGGLFGFVGTVAPGFLLLYLFKPELISSLETIKVIIFSLALSVPIVLVNLPIAIYLSGEHEDKYLPILFAMMLSSTVFYFALITTYLFNFNFKEFLIAVLVLQFLVSIVAIIDRKIKKNKNES
jgi:Na+-driven multidrug efflux pump